MKRYNPKELEPKWQKQWDSSGLYQANLDSDKPKYVAFGMFNYPSGAGIHVGHAKNFTLPDVLIRAKRQQGFEAYSPVGFDSFGLPAENYAIKTGTAPRETTDKALENYRKQYRAMGWGLDWSKEIDTSSVDYYKWTQWCFLKLHENGLAYQKESLQWWCEQCKTVLADEQVNAGKCWRHESPGDPYVTKRSLKQWFIKITDYADEILEATDNLDWTPWVKVAQKNWIGRSEGAEIMWQVCDAEGKETGATIKTFSTRKDTIPGVTFIVVAPGSPLLDNLTSESQRKAVEMYRSEVLLLDEVERQANKDKSGVALGTYAKNPFNGALVPIFVASYVLEGYGTGVVMGMGGHDLRDREFSLVHNLPVILTTNVSAEYSDLTSTNVWTEPGTQINTGEGYDGLTSKEAGDKIFSELKERGQAIEMINYKLRDWLISRQRYWGAPIPIIHCESCGAVPVPESDLPVVLPEVEDYKPSGDGRSPLANVDDWVNVDCPKCGKQGKRETDTMDGYVCSSWYQIRYMDPHNSEAAWDVERANKWLPVDFYNGGDHATAHLLYARFFTRFFHKIGLLDTPEPFKHMYFHAKITAPGGEAFSKTLGNGVDPLEIIDSGYGADALRTYICFIAPPDVESPWNDDGVPGVYRFLNRFWVLTQEYLEASKEGAAQETNKELLSIIHRTIKKVTSDIADVKLNTAIAAMMECVNEMYKIKDKDNYSSADWGFGLQSLAQLLAPFAPHIAEEIWQDLGNPDSVHVDHWPECDESYLATDTVTVAVQVNGKLRGELEVSIDEDKEAVISKAKQLPKVAAHLTDKTIRKEIYVSNRVVNIVV